MWGGIGKRCSVPRLVNPKNHHRYAHSNTIPAFYPRLRRRSPGSSTDGLPDIRVDHLVIGAGVVGLATARRLTELYPEKSTFLVERHKRPGEETSSRNSEVIHAGLYYPAASLKTNLCLRGRELLYEFCQQHNVPHKQTGKLVVGTSDSKEYLEGILRHVASLSHTDTLGALIAGERSAPPVRVISGDEARELEPDLGPNVGWTLESPRTGIVNSHELMATLERHILESESAEIVYDTDVVGLRPSLGGDESVQGWVVETQTEGGDVDSLLARHVIQAGGLNGPAALNSLVRDGYLGQGREQIGMWYSKGNYASYAKSKGGVDHVRHLIYPLPDMGSSRDAHGHQGLGTHLTLDLDGNIRFGPDTDWLMPPHDSNAKDWWNKNLVALQSSDATMNQEKEEQRLAAMHESVTSFLPNLRLDGLNPDYAGIRPKLNGPGAGFMDFQILYHTSRNLHVQETMQSAFSPRILSSLPTSASKAYARARKSLYMGTADVQKYRDAEPSLVTLCGIESPGLTSSLAIAEVVAELIARRGWGTSGPLKVVPPGAQNEDAGSVDDWA